MNTFFKKAVSSAVVFSVFHGGVPRAIAEVGVTSQDILVGESTALTGKDPERPIQFQKGGRLFFSQVNAAGGVYGRKIKVVTYDDGYDPQKTFYNVRKLINEDKVFALFQVYGTPNNKSALNAIELEGIPLVAPLSAGQFLRTPVKPSVFAVRPGASDESDDMVNLLIKKGITEISVFHQDDALGMEGLSSTQKAFLKNGITRISEGKYNRNSQNVDPAVAQIEKGDPKGILLWAVAKPASEFVKKYSLKHPGTVFVGHSGTFATEFLEGLKGVTAEVYSFSSVPPLQSALPFVKEYAKAAQAAGEIPTTIGLEGYLNAAIFIEGLKGAGSELSRKKLLQALEKMTDVSLGGIDISFSPTKHQALSKSYANKVDHGKFVPLD